MQKNRSPDSSVWTGSKKSEEVLGPDWKEKSWFMKNDRLTIKEQCELLEVNRTSMYYQPVEPAEKALEREEYIKSRIDYWHTKFCYIGHRKIKEKLVQEDGICNRQKTCQTLYDGNEYLSSLSETQSFKARKEQFKISVSAEKSKN